MCTYTDLINATVVSIDNNKLDIQIQLVDVYIKS